MKTQLNKYFLIAAFAGTQVFGQQKIQPYVDERVELMSTLFRLIEAREYSDRNNELYVQDIEKYFAPVKSDPFLSTLKNIRNENGIGYDAVMSMAVHLKIKDQKISLVKERNNTVKKRWKTVDLPVFLKGLSSFYKNSKYNQFFQSHQADYKQAAKAYSDSVLTKFQQDWYVKFYGKEPNEDYKIVLGYGNGGGNYGPKVSPEKGKDIVYAIVSGGKFTGRTVGFSGNYAPTLIHEFNHSFVNYILETKDYKSQLQDAGEKIQKEFKKPMADQAYSSWETIINESIVRAAVLVYMKENHFSQAEINNEMKEQISRSFIWTPDLVKLLEEYQANRKQYPDLEAFYPRIVSFFQNTGKNMDKVLSDFTAKRPKVKSLSPDINGKNNIDTSIKEIIVEFDQPLSGRGLSIHWGELGRDAVPISARSVYINDNKGLKIPVDLKPDKEYEFVLVGGNFESIEGYPLQDYTIKFKTK
ncbi:DUF4932 domain-containing protein [Elizabethkingia anophelis]|uniref:DUF4932 domain-containing protein n=1 Tax=Elizabethkingia anophelis TaxID=1117645 RepID=UPI0038922251